LSPDLVLATRDREPLAQVDVVVEAQERDGLGRTYQVVPGVLPQSDYRVPYVSIPVVVHLQVQRKLHMVALYFGVGQIVEAGEVTPIFGKGGDRG